MKDLESGVTLMKDKDDKKEWTERDLVRMKKKKLIKGYDVEYNNNFIIVDVDEVQYMYLVGEEQCLAVQNATESPDGIEDEESMRWKNNMPQPSWGDRDNGVMFG